MDLLLLRDGLVRMLTDTGHDVVAAVPTVPELEAAVTEHRPDLSIVDVRMPPTFRDEGLRAALAIRRREPKTPILILSQYVERAYAAELIADGNGAVGYLRWRSTSATSSQSWNFRRPTTATDGSEPYSPTSTTDSAL